MIYAQPGQSDAVVSLKAQYANFIDGKWQAPVKGQYFENISPVTGKAFCQIPRSTAEDIELALDAAQVLASLKSRLANFKIPKRCFVVSELPRNTMGKVQKNLLRDQHKGLFA